MTRTAVVALALVALAACGGGGGTAPEAAPATLAGRWVGTEVVGATSTAIEVDLVGERLVTGTGAYLVPARPSFRGPVRVGGEYTAPRFDLTVTSVQCGCGVSYTGTVSGTTLRGTRPARPPTAAGYPGVELATLTLTRAP